MVQSNASREVVEAVEVVRVVEVADPRGPCPQCGKTSVLVLSMDRFVHIDGSDNRACWDAGLDGDFALYQPTLDRTTNPEQPTLIKEAQ